VPPVFVSPVSLFSNSVRRTQGGCNAVENPRPLSRYNKIPYYFFNGDGVADTPAHSGPTKYEDERKVCWRGQGLNTCPDNQLGVDPGMDPINNYMNYGHARCRLYYGTFTTGQIERMVAEYEAYRLCAWQYKPCARSKDCCGHLVCRAGKKKGQLRCLNPPNAKQQKNGGNNNKTTPKNNNGKKNSDGCKKRDSPCSSKKDCCGTLRCKATKSSRAKAMEERRTSNNIKENKNRSALIVKTCRPR